MRLYFRHLSMTAISAVFLISSTSTAVLGVTVTAEWLNPVSGNWTDPTKWSTNPVYPNNGSPGSSDAYSATIDATGNNYTVDLNNSITLTDFTLGSANATLNHTGGTLSVLENFNLLAGTYRLRGGTISGTTISGAVGSQIFVDANYEGTTLDGVTLGTNLSYQGTGPIHPFTSQNGLTLDNATLTLGTLGGVWFHGDQSLSGTGEVLFSGTTTSYVQADGGHLTIGSGITLKTGNQDGGVKGRYDGGWLGSIENHATILSEVSGRAMVLGGSTFENYGLLQTNNGGRLTISNLENHGTVIAGAGSTLVLSKWTNDGSITATNADVELWGAFTTADMLSINRTGGTLRISGTVDNTGSTLALDSLTGSWPLWISGAQDIGTIHGGTITAVNPAGLQLLTSGPSNAGGRFDDVLLDADLRIERGKGIRVLNTLTLAAGRKIVLTGNDNGSSTREVNFYGPSTLDGEGEVIFDGGNYTRSLLRPIDGMLTIGPDIIIRTGTGGGTIGSTNVPLLNQGLISAQTLDQAIVVTGSGWTNSGVLEAKNGGTLFLDGTFSTSGLGRFSSGSSSTIRIMGVLDNTDDVLTLNTATGPLYLTGSVAGGEVNAANGATLIVNGGTLDSVDYGGSMIVTTATIKNGLTLSNGVISGSGNSSSGFRLTFDGTQSLGGLGEIVLSGTQSATASVVATENGILTIGSGITVRSGTSGGTVGGDSYPTINQGTISSQTAGKVIKTFSVNNQGIIEALTNASVIMDGEWTNSGTFRVSGGALELGGVFATSDIGTFDRTGGTVSIAGELDNSSTTLNIDQTTGTLQLVTKGRIGDGTIRTFDGEKLVVPQGYFQESNGPKLDGVTFGGDLLVDRSNLWIGGGITLDNANVSLSSGYIRFGASGQTIGGTGDISMSGSNSGIYADVGSSFVIGPNVTVKTATGGGEIGQTGSILQNQGTIWSATASKTLAMRGNWSNTGTLKVSNGILSLGGNFTTTGIGTIDRTGGEIHIAGNLNNASSTLVQNASTGSFTLANGGKITGGIISSSTSTPLVVNGTSTLDNVTLNGELLVRGYSDLTIQNGMEMSSATIRMSTTSGSTSWIRFQPGMAIAGSGQIIFDSPGYSQSTLLVNGGKLIVPADLTVRTGTGGGSFQTSGSNRGLQNYGLISAETTGQRISINDLHTQNYGVMRAINGAWLEATGNTSNHLFQNNNELLADSGGTVNIYGHNGILQNAGTAVARNGGTLSLARAVNTGSITSESNGIVRLLAGWSNPAGGTVLADHATIHVGLPSGGFGDFTADHANIFFNGAYTTAQTIGIDAQDSLFGLDLYGVLDNTAGGLTTNVGTNRWHIAGGIMFGGQVTSTNATPLWASSSTSILENITLDTDLEIAGGATVKVQNGVALTNGRSIIGAGTVVFSNLSGTHQLRALSGSFNINSGVTVRNSGYNGTVGDSSSGVVNFGKLYADTNGVTLSIRGNAITNNGVFESANGGTLRVEDVSSLTNLSGTTLTGGVWTVGASSTIDIPGAQITHNAADIRIKGNNTHFDAIDSLASNSGKLTLSNSAAYQLENHFSNGGETVVEIGSTLAAMGVFTQESSGRFTLHWYPTAWGRIQVAGSAQIDGTLNIVRSYPYGTPGQSYEILRAASLTGMFGTVIGRELPFGRYFDVVYDADSVTLVVEQAGQGDSDFDGDVDLNDLSTLAANYGAASGALWSQGDYDYDGDVDLNDLSVLAANYGTGEVQAFADFASLAAVPEPTSSMVLVGMLWAVSRRRS